MTNRRTNTLRKDESKCCGGVVGGEIDNSRVLHNYCVKVYVPGDTRAHGVFNTLNGIGRGVMRSYIFQMSKTGRH